MGHRLPQSFAAVAAAAVILLLSPLFFPACARAAVVIDLSTGIDSTTETQLTNNAPDPRYAVVAGGTGGFVGQTLIARSSPLPNLYLADGASTKSRWIAPNSGQGLEGISVNAGTFNVQTTVDLTGFLPNTAVIPTARFAIDDDLLGIQVNGTPIFTPGNGFQRGLDKFYGLPANMGAGTFHAGLNTITFNLQNNVPGTPLAFRLEATVTATPVPEPAAAAAAVVGLALGGTALLCRRRRSAYSSCLTVFSFWRN
jgi:hypothetical protein